MWHLFRVLLFASFAGFVISIAVLYAPASIVARYDILGDRALNQDKYSEAIAAYRIAGIFEPRGTLLRQIEKLRVAEVTIDPLKCRDFLIGSSLEEDWYKTNNIVYGKFLFNRDRCSAIMAENHKFWNHDGRIISAQAQSDQDHDVESSP